MRIDLDDLQLLITSTAKKLVAMDLENLSWDSRASKMQHLINKLANLAEEYNQLRLESDDA